MHDFDEPHHKTKPKLRQKQSQKTKPEKPKKEKSKSSEKQSKPEPEKPLNNKRNSEKQQSESQRKNRRKKQDKNVVLEETKQSSKMKAWQSEPDETFGSPEELPNPGKVIEHEKLLSDTTTSKLENQLSYACDAKSTRSEDKNDEIKIKGVNSTNPTSETSSFKDSSVNSHQDLGKSTVSPAQQKTGRGHKNSQKQTQNEKKTPNEKRTGKKNKKPLKSDRPKYG